MFYKKYLIRYRPLTLRLSLLALLSPCSGLHAQLTGTAGADDVSLTGANTGELNSSPFSGISSIDTAGGFDTVNTNASTTLTGINSQVITNGVTVSNFETLVSTDGNLVGSGSSDSFAITGANSGSVYGVDYNGIEHLSGGDGNDIFDFDNGGSVSGTIDGGAGNDILDYADETGAVAVSLADHSATSINGGGASGFSNIEGINGNGSGDTSVTGTAGADNFILGASNGDATSFGIQNLTVDGNGGGDTLTGTTGNDTFDIAGANSGSVGSVNFAGIENLSGGDGNETFDFGDAGSLSGTINGGAGIDVLDYSDKSGSVAVALSDNSATSLNGGAASGFSSIEGVIGNGTANTVIFGSGLSDSFIVGSTNGDAGNFGVSAATINAGGGSDTLTGTSGGDSFAITGADTGSVGSVNFSSVENLNGGAGNDTFSYIGSGRTSGDINGGADSDTITIDVGALGTFTFSGQIDNVEDIDLNGGTLVLNGSLTNGGTLDLATGTVLAGTGSIEAAQVNLNGGTIAPGTSPGTLSVDADLTATAASTFSFELNGLTPGSEFDQILFTGLGNTLTLADADLALTVGFSFNPGDEFVIISGFDTLSGQFAQGSLITVGEDEFNILYNEDNITLQAVPEPAAFALLSGLIVLGMGVTRRRR